MTKGEIDRLGEKIRNQYQNIPEDILNELQQYRISHKEPLSEIFKVLCDCTKRVHNENIVTYRIKRFESIIGKLSRYPQMKFSRMWDIGGCRCIVRNNRDVYKLKELIEKNLEIRKIYDYIANPQEEGYRSLHLFASVPGYDKIIEIQLRSQQDHSWATLVEITDLLFDSRLKEYKQNKELLRFHFLLSKVHDLDLNEKREIAATIKKYKYFEKLSTVFSRNYLQVRKQWFDIESKVNHRYFLIETKKDEVPKIKSFSSFNEAEVEYFSLYKTSHNANVVLTHLPNPCYNQISMAYSNYILTFHSFLTECYAILENLVGDSLKNRKYFVFFDVYNLYNSLLFIHIRNLLSEIRALNNNVNGTSRPLNKRKKKEWERDIKDQIERNNLRIRKFANSFQRNIPPTFWGRFVVLRMMNFIGSKYRRKIKKSTGYNK